MAAVAKKEDLFDEEAEVVLVCPFCHQPMSICQGSCVHEMYCTDCEECLCVFTQAEVHVIQCVNEWVEITRAEEELTGDPSANVCRKIQVLCALPPQAFGKR